MKKIMVIGCCGAGKSTFSRVLHEKLKIPLIHLDQYYWKPNWTETDPVLWTQKVKKLVQNEDWIIDGNYGGTMDIRLAEADTIFYLDISTTKALYRILKRSFTYLGETRPDMPSGCPERISWKFIHYVFNFNRRQRTDIFQKLKLHSKNKMIHILKSEKAIHDFLLTFES